MNGPRVAVGVGLVAWLIMGVGISIHNRGSRHGETTLKGFERLNQRAEMES